jgi:two-component system, OmpR family, sensor histidine kinase BaeS
MRRLSTKLALAMVVVAIVTAAIALPAAIVYTENRLDGLPSAERDRAVAQIRLNSWDDFDGLAEWAAVCVASGAVGVALGWLLARRITRPLRVVSATADRLAAGDLDARTGVRRGDEVGQLAADFDAMADDLQRLETDRRTANAAIAHELRTPVTVVRARLQAANDGLLELDGDEIGTLIDQLDGLTAIIEDLRVLSLATAGRLTVHPEPLELEPLLQAQVVALTAAATERHVQLELTRGADVTVCADRNRLAQVVGNLITNAIDHTPPNGEVRVSCARRTATDTGGSDQVVIVVSDTGPGFPEPVTREIFEPFHAGDRPDAPSSSSSGLGLAIVAAIVAAHDGTVDARNTSSGAEVTVVLPAPLRAR